MANIQAGKCVTLVAGEDLRGDYGEILTIDTDGRVVRADAATEVVVGVLAEDPRKDAATTGHGVPVALIGTGGVLKGKAGAAITAGQLLVPTATAGRIGSVDDSGSLVADQMAFGIALEGAAGGEIFSFLAMPIAAPHTA